MGEGVIMRDAKGVLLLLHNASAEQILGLSADGDARAGTYTEDGSSPTSTKTATDPAPADPGSCRR
jgi:hypothetical protein